ncbi:unnamed protein product [Protopolystoma xenopodis]|uniref:Uncharacterized protein n=1 Tax=Protopolystoma xenopodis TaxID=117903 RepID=A0A3S5ABH9_9PLAT|nr:unnamed protein product [Protopolystoma xenopodis]
MIHCSTLLQVDLSRDANSHLFLQSPQTASFSGMGSLHPLTPNQHTSQQDSLVSSMPREQTANWRSV